MATFLPGSVGVGSETVTEELPQGLLLNLSIFTEDTGIGPTSTWLTASILRGGTNNGNRITHIISGFVQSQKPISYHGSIVIQTTDTLQVTAVGNLTKGFRITHQIITANGPNPLPGILGNAQSA